MTVILKAVVAKQHNLYLLIGDLFDPWYSQGPNLNGFGFGGVVQRS